MTEEEIRPIAENYVEEYCHCSDGEYTDGSLVCAGIGTALIVSRQLEKRIAELEEAKANLEYLLEGRDNEIDELKKENKVLAQNLEDTEILNKAYEKRFDNLKKENAELKEQCSILADCNTCTSTCKTENIEMKKQLTKAKKIIKKFSEFVNNDVEYDPEHPQEYTDLWNKLCKEAEQFLNSEVEK